MKTALIFPGQGSQKVGMGNDFYLKYKTSRYVYNKLNQNLNKDITDIIFSGSELELSNTQNSQPSIMATSIAILEALKAENLLTNISYQAVAGHSLGEYTALVANGSIDFEESVRLLKIRSKAMQESMPLGSGGMVAIIGCKTNSINQILNDASKNGNAEGQIVLSGEINAIEFILENSKTLDFRKAVKLPVSAPFHCELMQHASNVLQPELDKINFREFDVPLYSNVTSKSCSASEISNLLVRQVTSRVRWREIIENMEKDGFNRFIEIGPGTVLTNLVKRISKNVEVYSISKVEDFDILKDMNL